MSFMTDDLTRSLCVLGLFLGFTAPALSQVRTKTDLPTLPTSEGSAEHLEGTLAKDGSLWLGGVGGDGDIEATETLESSYEIRSDSEVIIVPGLTNEEDLRGAPGEFRHKMSVPVGEF